MMNSDNQKRHDVSVEKCEVGEKNSETLKNKELQERNSSIETLFHVIKGCFGTGILAMPQAFKYAGMVNGIVATILIGFFNAFCFHTLTRTQDVLRKRKQIDLLSYPDSMEMAISIGPHSLRKFTRYASSIINGLLIIYQIGACAVYILFVAENLQFRNEWLLNEIILTLFIPFFLITLIKNLKILSPISLLGNVICVGTYIVIVYYAFADAGENNKISLFGKAKDFPLFFGTALYSLQSIGVMTTAENNMVKPNDFRKRFGVLNIGMSIITTVYIFIASIGYWRYGDTVLSSITRNFKTNPTLGQCVRILYSLAIFVSYPINMHVVFNIFKDDIEKRVGHLSEFKKLLVDYFHRLAWVILTFLLAIGVPFLDLATSFLGNFNVCLLLFVFPAVMQICVFWHDERWEKWILWKNIIVVLLGMLAFSAGTYSTVYNITTRY